MAQNERMKRARKELGLSQEELARKIGVSRQTINMIERGDYNPTLKLCIQLCHALGTTLDALFWEEETPDGICFTRFSTWRRWRMSAPPVWKPAGTNGF